MWEGHARNRQGSRKIVAEIVEDSYLDKFNGDKQVCTEQDKLRFELM